MPWSRRSPAVGVAAIVGLLALLSVPAPAAAPDTVVIGSAQEPDNLIEPFTGMGVAREIVDSIFVSAMNWDDRWKSYPGLIEKIPTLKDGDWQLLPNKRMRITYRLKRGYTWHDGRPVTALDTSWTYLMLRNPRSPTLLRFLLPKIDHMLVPDPNDPYTLVVQWNELWPFANLGYPTLPTLPRHILERDYLRDPASLKAHLQARAPIANGPYRFVEWVPGSHITLEAYDAFIGGRPKIRRIVWRFILDSTALQAAVISGQVDVTPPVSNLSIEQAVEIERRNPQVVAHYAPGFILEHIALNLDNEWLKDRRVREAIIHAINREEISARLFYGKQPVAHTWLPERHEAHNRNVRKYAYDPVRARSLLSDAGFVPGPDGMLRDATGKRVEMTIMTTAGNLVREQIQQILREQLRAVGIDLRADNRPASVLFGSVVPRRQFPHMAMYAFGFLPIVTGASFWHSGQIPSPANNWAGFNYSGWRNLESDRLLEQAAEELDTEKRVRLIRRQQEIWAEELPAIPLYFRVYLATSKRSLRNFRPGPSITWNSETWEWMQ